MLVSAVIQIMSIYQLPLEQYGYTGHVINLHQDVVTFAHSLLRLPSKLDISVIRKDNEQSHRDFHVHISVVQEALAYLLENNGYYVANYVNLSHETLQQLPHWRSSNQRVHHWGILLYGLPHLVPHWSSWLRWTTLQPSHPWKLLHPPPDDDQAPSVLVLHSKHLDEVVGASSWQDLHSATPSWRWMSFVTWWEEMERLSPTEFSTTLQVFVAPDSTGSERNLFSIVDAIGLPSVFFTHSAADLQWPELACLILPRRTWLFSKYNQGF